MSPCWKKYVISFLKHGKWWVYLSFLVDDEKDKKEEKLVPEKVLAIIEEAYPNSLTIDDMSRRFKSETEIVRNMILELVNKKLVKPVGAGVPGAAGLDSAAGRFELHLKTVKA